MRIGIMTFHSALNCGAVLQAFALQTYLENMGHKVEFINYRGINKKTFRDFIGKGFFKTLYKLEDIYQSFKHSKKDAFGYVLKRGNLQYFSIEELQKNPPDYDVYIAGSDQIWNINSANCIEKPYFLDFGSKNIKRIAFAASFGQCNVPKFLDFEIKNQLLNFDSISVRESNGVEYLRSILGDIKEVYQISDPTILLKALDYKKIFSWDPYKFNRDYIISYILSSFNSEQLEIVSYVRNKLNFKIKNLRNPDTCFRLPNAENIVVTPYQWLNYFYNAEFIICSSFHAVIFSLIFHKNFIVISPNKNQRIISLLSLFQMEDYYFSEFNKALIDKIIRKEIDWERVEEILMNERSKSTSFLLISLS